MNVEPIWSEFYSRAFSLSLSFFFVLLLCSCRATFPLGGFAMVGTTHTHTQIYS